MFPHPQQIALHKYLVSILEERSNNHRNVISRISHFIVTDQDVREFVAMIGDVYEKSYLKALQDYHKQLEAAGIKVSVSYTKSDK